VEGLGVVGPGECEDFGFGHGFGFGGEGEADMVFFEIEVLHSVWPVCFGAGQCWTAPLLI